MRDACRGDPALVVAPGFGTVGRAMSDPGNRATPEPRPLGYGSADGSRDLERAIAAATAPHASLPITSSFRTFMCTLTVDAAVL